MMRSYETSVSAQISRRIYLLSAITLLVISIAAINNIYSVLHSTERELHSAAIDVAHNINTFVQGSMSYFQAVAHQLVYSNAPQLALRALLEDNPAVFHTAYLDEDGWVVAERRRVAALGVVRYDDQPWLSAVRSGDVYWGETLRRVDGLPFVMVAFPVAEGQQWLGTLLIEFDLSTLWGDIRNIKFGRTGYAYLLEGTGELLAFRDMALVRNRLGTSFQNHHSDYASGNGNLFQHIYFGLTGELVLSGSQSLRLVDWVAVVEIPLAETFEQVWPVLLFTVLLWLAILAIISDVSRVARYLLMRLNHLLQGVGELRRGNLAFRFSVPATTMDEISSLAMGFNQLTSQLRDTINNLETLVANRTRALRLAADVSKSAASELNLERLLPELVERIATAFDLYGALIYLYDPTTRTLELAAANGMLGQLFLRRGRQVKIDDEQGLVNWAALERQMILAGNVSFEARHVANPIFNETRCELAMPLLVGGNLVGVLDLQARQVNRFSEEDLSVVTSLAEQFAIAIQNAGLYADQVRVSEELRRLDAMKSQFLANISHELRTPLNAVINFTRFVASGMLGAVNDKQADALNKAVGSAKHLLSLINDLLDLTKIEANMMHLFREKDVDLYDEIRSVLPAVEVILEGKEVGLIQDIAPNLPLIEGDKRRIRQILLNLLSNAAKFTDKGSITLAVQQQDAEIYFRVQDTGVGIALEDQERIFQPFQQAPAGMKHALGTGLGLPITLKLVEAHGGRLWLESILGEGTTFHFTLPIHSDILEAFPTE